VGGGGKRPTKKIAGLAPVLQVEGETRRPRRLFSAGGKTEEKEGGNDTSECQRGVYQIGSRKEYGNMQILGLFPTC